MKYRLLSFVSFVMLSLAGSISLFAEVNVIPAPQSVEMTEQIFNKKNLGKVKYVNSKELPSEAYELQILKNRIVIKASDEAGRFYAHQTLSQLAEADVMHCGIIKDTPRYSWRGFMLDEARHFFGKDQVKELLDMMARYKLNRFHWHLSDDQGWRVEIKAYPELCTVGGIGCYSDSQKPAQFYTQEDIREIIAYAAERHIEIIPEIDMPGHATAFTNTFPHLGAGSRTVNPSLPELYDVLETIIKELAELFPGRYFHIGGDEVSTRGWRQHPDIPAFMEKEGISSYDDIQKYFERRILEIVSKTGKKAIAWDDVIESGMDKDKTLIHWWRADHPETLEKSLEMGYSTIISPYDPFYLDYIQDERCKEGHLVWKCYVNSLQDIYEFKLNESPLVVGVQSNLWTERVRTNERLEYMIYPRILALAERAWTHETNLNYDNFLKRLENEYVYLDSINVHYYDFRNFDSHPEPLK